MRDKRAKKAKVKHKSEAGTMAGMGERDRERDWTSTDMKEHKAENDKASKRKLREERSRFSV